MLKFKQFITSTFLLVCLMLGLGQPFAGQNRSAAATAEVTQKDSLFLIDLGLVRSNKDSIYVFDKDDSTIKVVSGTTHKFEVENDRIPAENVNDLLFFEDDMIIYSQDQNEPHLGTLSAVSLKSESFGEEVSLSGDENLTTLSSAKCLEIVKCGEQNYLILYPTDPVNGKFEFAKITKEENQITFSEVKTFSISSSVGEGALVQSYDHVRTFDDDGQFFMVFSKDKTLLVCSLNPDSPADINTVSEISVTGDKSIDENIINYGFVRFYNAEQDELAIVSSSKVSFWNLNKLDKTLTKSERDDITFMQDFVLTDSSAKEGYISCIDSTAQQLVIYDLNEPTFNPEGYLVENDHVHEGVYEDIRDYVYLKVEKDTPIKQTPYTSSLNPLATAKKDHYVAVIGKGYNQDDKLIDGWNYIIYTEAGVNYYGYVSTDDTRTILDSEVEEYGKSYVTVMAYTKIYCLPSNVLDQKNFEVREIETSSAARLHVISNLRDYTTFGLGETSNKYLLVSVNGTDIGFVDRDRVIEVSSVTGRVLPNATVMRNNCQIFVKANDKGETLDVILNKGDRVKVVGKRDTITNYTLITFNDEDGNELTGYIYTYNLEADSWNTVQFIGMLLVFINVVLLVVIIFVRNKVSK